MRLLPGLLPLLALPGLYAASLRLSARPDPATCHSAAARPPHPPEAGAPAPPSPRRRRALARAFVLWGCLVALVTETTSLAHALSPGPLLAFWGVVLAASLALAVRDGQGVPLASRPGISVPTLGLATILLGTLALALAAPPNTWDSMTYHSSRVARWAQNQSVAFFPTSCVKQLYMAPWAEYAVAQLQVLSGGDRLANLVQWLAQIGCLSGVSLVAARLGASVRGQTLAAVFAATLPMGILQASGTQTDLAAALWLVLFVALGHEAAVSGTIPDALWAGGALGLAVLTKQSGYLYGAPLALWIGLCLLRRHRVRALAPALAAASMALLLNVAPYARCEDLWGSPLGPASHPAHFIEPKAERPPEPIRRWLPARAVKNLALHLGSPFASWNAAVADVMRAADERRQSWYEALPKEGPRVGLVAQEDVAGNPLHLALVVALGGVLLARRPRSGAAAARDELTLRSPGGAGGGAPPPNATALLVAIAAGAVVFLYFIPWQAFNSRLHLSLFVLAAPVVAVALDEHPRLAAATGALLLVASLPWLLRGLPRRLVGADSVFRLPRESQYFRSDPPRERQMAEQARFLREHACRSVGLVRGDDTWEYPLHVLAPPGTLFHEAAIDNLTRGLPPEPGTEREDCVCDLDRGGCRLSPSP